MVIIKLNKTALLLEMNLSKVLTLKAPITTAADDILNFFFFFFNFSKKTSLDISCESSAKLVKIRKIFRNAVCSYSEPEMKPNDVIGAKMIVE